MTDRPGPHDRPGVSDQDRAWMEYDARVRKTVDVQVGASRTRFGCFLNFLESLFRSSRPNNWG